MKDKLFLIESYDFISKPIGGQAIFSLNMLRAYEDELFLVGWANYDEPVGEIVFRESGQKQIRLFTIAKRKKRKAKYFVPSRLLTFWGLFKFRKKIINLGIKRVFTSAPESLFFLITLKDIKIYFRMAGLSNPIKYSKYKYLRKLHILYDFSLKYILKKVDLVLATSDDKEIINFKKRYAKSLINITVKQFPTRVDTSIFNSDYNKTELRILEKIDLNKKVIITVGRLAAGKGWKLMIDSFNLFLKVFPDSILILIGSGEDESQIIRYVKSNALDDKVILKGRKEAKEIAQYLNIADLFIMGSYREGWSTTLLEAMACNSSVCVTDFSCADTLIIEDVNGYVLKNRKPESFMKSMIKALDLKVDNSKLINKYSVENLKRELDKYFNEVN